MNWEVMPFEDLYAIPSKNGVTRPSNVRGSGFKMINMGELFANDRLADIEMERVQLNEKEIASMLVEPGDLLFARQSLVLSGAGKCSIVINAEEPTTFESHLIRVRLRKDLADPRFFHYYFNSPSSGIRSIVTQGVQAGIRGNDLKRLSVRVPPRAVQERIANFISAYDDLMENNRRRIKLLEESVRFLYREWFLCLRFPGHEHVRGDDGVPEGWELKPLGDLIKTASGGTPSRKKPELYGEGFLWVKTKELNGGFIFDTEEKITRAGLEGSSAKMFPAGTVLLAMYGATIGATAILGTPATTNQACCAFLVSDIKGLNYYCFQWLKEIKDVLVGMGMGAAQPNLSQEMIRKINFLMPPKSLLSEFDECVGALFRQMAALTQYNEKLAQARDLLLPRLMSGEIEV